jgi:hypothetical protein
VIGQFPWDPFPAGEPDPKGPDPIHGIAYRAAVTAADAYRSVRLALRRESGTLRLGNRFVADGRYREVAFLAFGGAANSMGLAALHAIGDRLTQGFLAGPDEVPPELPFRGVTVPAGLATARVSEEVVRAATEIAEGLGEQDLLLVLVSPGAIRSLARPPQGASDDEFSALLTATMAAGSTGREVDLVARVVGTGAVGGRLAAAIPRADVATFLVDRGDGTTVLGGGPMRPVDPTERVEARAALERLGLYAGLPRTVRDRLSPGADDGAGSPTRYLPRSVVVASPSDALRAAADAVFDKGWTSRLAFLEIRDGPAPGADRFLARSEELIVVEGLTTDSRTKGVGTFAMTTLGLPEGLDEGPALGSFLERARKALRRREMSVGLFRTVGAVGSPLYPAGAVVGAPNDPTEVVPPDRARALRMRRGITDVGLLAVGLCRPPSATRSTGSG